jgi:O-antigen/teichoic acid export membrane protein
LYQYVDSVMLGYLRTDAETGLYGAAFKIYEGLIYGAMAISAVLTPRLSALFVSNRPRHRAMSIAGVLGSAAFGACVGFVAYLIAVPAVTIPFGADFAPAGTSFRILCAAMPIVFAFWILHAVAISVDRERLLLKTGVIGLAVNVGINLYTIPYYGGPGAAVATFVGEAVSAVVLIAGLWTALRPAPAPQTAPTPSSSR